MVQRRAEIEPFISGVFNAYVHTMALEGIWGGVGTHCRTCCLHACMHVVHLMQHHHAKARATRATQGGLTCMLSATDAAMRAGEPELAVAVHCLQRPIIVYKQVQFLTSCRCCTLCTRMHACMRAAVPFKRAAACCNLPACMLLG